MYYLFCYCFCEYFFCVCWLHWWRKKAFREISSNVTIDNSFDYATKTYTLVINLVDDSKYDINLNNRNDSIIDCSVKDSVYTCTGFKSGDYDFTIDGITDTCDITLKRINVKLPKYNKYYEQDICDGYHYLDVCSEFLIEILLKMNW